MDQWVFNIVDSLRQNKVDTIEYYHAYCGECMVEKPNTSSCYVNTGWTQIQNTIIYKQEGVYYSLTFNCSYPPIKQQLQGVKSLDYFLSITSLLDKRDKYQAVLRKNKKFNPPVIVDGGYEEAVLYYNGSTKSVYMQENQKNDKVWRSLFWIDKQTKLLKLMESETSRSN